MYRNILKNLRIFGSLILVSAGSTLFAQSKPAISSDNSSSFSDVSLKKNSVTDPQSIRPEDIVWKRDVYRIVDLKSGVNGTLYYPTEPSGEQMNLFSTLFDLLANNKVTAYDFLDGRESFTEPYLIKFKDVLKRYDIAFKERPNPQKANTTILDIDATNIPSTEVTLFYVKEMYFLDQRTSTIKIKTVALCPILVREDEVGETRRYPMFWIPFESLRPYLSQMAVAPDTWNSAKRISAYDFFNQRRYQGDLYKVSNLKNQTIWDYCKTPEAIKAEQERLEKSLSILDAILWEPSQKQMREELEMQKAKETKATMSEKKGKKVK